MNAVLFSAINIYVQVSPREGTNLRNSMFPYVGIYSSLVTARITSLLTTLLSIERFVAVRFPMKAKFICNKKSLIFRVLSDFHFFLVLQILNIIIVFRQNINKIGINRNIKFIVIPYILQN
jgi:hypothetical protein